MSIIGRKERKLYKEGQGRKGGKGEDSFGLGKVKSERGKDSSYFTKKTFPSGVHLFARRGLILKKKKKRQRGVQDIPGMPELEHRVIIQKNVYKLGRGKRRNR